MKRVILSGGGTGGHIYPAVSVAEALKKRLGDDVEILFVGAEGKMEMSLIPKLGYNIKGLTIVGLQRHFTWKNFALPYYLLRSLNQARRIIKEFKPDVVAGFGGYASAPIVFVAQRMGVPTIIQEQNSYAGLVNKIVCGRAKKVCVAYEGMERFFDKAKIVLTGNPLRSAFGKGDIDRKEAFAHYGLKEGLPTILVVGGSLGTRTLNNMMKSWIVTLGGEAPVQVVWQTGRFYEKEMREFFAHYPTKNISLVPFIDRMDFAYEIADVVISRSGACTVSELCLAAKPTLFVPSPNVAEDHQTKNARALVDKNAAMMVSDAEAVDCGIATALKMVADEPLLAKLSKNIAKLATPDAAERVADEILKQIKP
ncbi:MAG: undecaprenyldiphospho-muramoylpentapeptide beta-N-acetylglucosaminyltransferase [Rikenellaceae bacterium]|nr:undecaprenyldiphospho-muramoylpentapeptide beta-N-acetylglucosaminyltransferase [Rikenellaceae bacterium]